MRKQFFTRTWAARLAVPVIILVSSMPVSSLAKGPRSIPTATHHVLALKMAMRLDSGQDDLGATTYKTQCALCHGADGKGVPPVFPGLIGVPSRLTDAQIVEIVHNGKGRMPAQPSLEPAAVNAVIGYLKAADKDPPTGGSAPPTGIRAEVVGAQVCDKNCALCHGEDLLGAPSNYPALVGVRGRLSDEQILVNVRNGKGRMPAFPQISKTDSASLLRFLGDTPTSTRH